MARSDSLRTALAFGVALYQSLLPRRSTSLTGAGGSPQLTDRPSLHAISSTPERVWAAPESTAQTAAFARPNQARPARSLTGLPYDAAEIASRYGLQFCVSSLDGSDFSWRRRLATGLLWRLARAGLTSAGRSALHWAHSGLATSLSGMSREGVVGLANLCRLAASALAQLHQLSSSQ
jgi:hypothetical protein